jgi:hypothetical protein
MRRTRHPDRERRLREVAERRRRAREIEIDQDASLLQEMAARSGGMTVTR